MIYKIYAHYFQQKGDQTRPMFATRNKPTRPREKHIYFWSMTYNLLSRQGLGVQTCMCEITKTKSQQYS